MLFVEYIHASYIHTCKPPHTNTQAVVGILLDILCSRELWDSLQQKLQSHDLT